MKSTKQQKVIKGTFRADRERSETEVKGIDYIPEPKMSLTDRQLEIFKAICQELIDSGRLKKEYIRLITRMAINWDLLEKVKKELDDHGPVNITSTGYVQVNGYFSTWTALNKQIGEFETKFGLDLSSNEKLNIREPEKPDQLDQLLRKNG